MFIVKSTVTYCSQTVIAVPMSMRPVPPRDCNIASAFGNVTIINSNCGYVDDGRLQANLRPSWLMAWSEACSSSSRRRMVWCGMVW